MSPADAVRRLAAVHVEAGDVRCRLSEHSDEAIQALRLVKPGVLLLAEAADRAGCEAPLVELVHVFRDDLVLFTAGEFTEAAVVDAIETLAPIHGWQWAA